MASKILTVYYSRKGQNYWNGSIVDLEKGNAETAAEFIQKAVGGALFEIDTTTPYPAEYKDCCAQAQKERQVKARPEIKNRLDSIDEFDVIFVVFPCWFGTLPMCLFTFLDQYDLSGKKIAPLCSHEGSGMGNSERDLRENYPNATVVEGLPVRGSQTSENEIKIAEWAKRFVQ